MSTTGMPAWILDLGRELREQDDAITADPVFQVRHIRTLPAPTEFDPEGWVQVAEDGSDTWGFVPDSEPEPKPDPGATVEPVWVYHEVVQSFLTRSAAQEYLESNAHNLFRPEIYVASGYRNYELQKIRAWLISLATPDKTKETTS